MGCALVEVFGFLLRKGEVRPVSSSPGFFLPRFGLRRGVRLVEFALFFGAFVSLLHSEGYYPIHSAFGLFAASHGFLRLLTSVSGFLHQFWRLCVWFLLGGGSIFLLYERVLFLVGTSDSFGS